MRTFFLGDIHRNFNLIHQYINQYDIKDANIVQVGDFGIGFCNFIKDKRALEMYHTKLVKNNVFVYAIRGNHDFKGYFDNDPFGFTNIKLVRDYDVLKLGTKKKRKNVLCLGGAVSVDRLLNKTRDQIDGIHNNEPGLNWWNNEGFVLDVDRLGGLRDIDIIATHTCPDYCPPDNTFGFGYFVENLIRRTGDLDLKTDLLLERRDMTDAFQILKLNNDIKFAYNGHFHKSTECDMYGTRHRCLGVGELWEENMKGDG